MNSEFASTVHPIAFNIQIKLDSSRYKIVAGYGSPEVSDIKPSMLVFVCLAQVITPIFRSVAICMLSFFVLGKSTQITDLKTGLNLSVSLAYLRVFSTPTERIKRWPPTTCRAADPRDFCSLAEYTDYFFYR